MVLEGAVARVAAERRTEHDIRLMRLLWQKFGDVSGSDAMVEANRQFHRAVWRASHNESLLDLLERLSLHLARYPETTLSAPGRWQTAHRQHKQLVDAIERRDGDGAKRGRSRLRVAASVLGDRRRKWTSRKWQVTSQFQVLRSRQATTCCLRTYLLT